MGLCGSRQDYREALARPVTSDIITVYGDMFQAETRSIVGIIRLADMGNKFQLKKIDQFS